MTVAMLGACSSNSRTPARPDGGSSTTTNGAPAAPPFPAGTRPADVSGAIALLGSFFETDPAVHWYGGGGFESSNGSTTGVVAQVFASTAAAAQKYCSPLSSAAAFFLQGHSYTLDLNGSVIQPNGVVVPAKYPAIRCPAYSGPIVDPIPPTIPKTLPAAATRFGKFLDEYIGTFGHGGDDAWEFDSKTSGGRVTVEVNEPSASAGLKRCAAIRPLANWLLGRFAKAITLQVAAGANVSWPTQNCPSS